MESGLAGKTVLITGASGGIGRATARAFSDEGCRLVLHYGQNPSVCKTLARELPAATLAIGADMRSEEQVDAMFKNVVQHFDRLDVLIVNAGTWTEEDIPLHQMTLEQWNDTLAVDLTGPFLCCRAFFRHLAEDRRDSAAIVLVGSTAGLFGEEGHCDYASAKAALTHGLTSTLKNEIVRLAPLGRVNCVSPGWVDTPMARKAMGDSALTRRIFSTMALRKVAKPEDVARAIVFLSSDEQAGHLSGAVLPIAGGMEGRLLHE